MKENLDNNKSGAKKDNVDIDTEEEIKEKENNSKSKEEVIIKYGFIGLGIILAMVIVVFVGISLMPKNALSVGDKKVSLEEFEYHYYEQKNMVYQQIAAYYPEITEEVMLMSEYSNGITYHEMIKQLALERVSDIAILTDMSEKDDYRYDEVELKESIENFRSSFEEYAQQSNMKVNDVAKGIYGTDYKTVLKIYEKTWISGKYQDELMEDYKANLTEEEISQYYEMFKDDIDKVTVKQLFISTFDAKTKQGYNEEDYEDAKARAEAIYEKVQKGEDFDELVLEFSEDVVVEETLGEYTTKKNEIGLVAFEEWAFSQDRVEQEIDLIETEIGFHIVKFLKRTDLNDSIASVRDNKAYGKMMEMLSQKKKLPEYEIGYYETFKNY